MSKSAKLSLPYASLFEETYYEKSYALNGLNGQTPDEKSKRDLLLSHEFWKCCKKNTEALNKVVEGGEEELMEAGLRIVAMFFYLEPADIDEFDQSKIQSAQDSSAKRQDEIYLSMRPEKTLEEKKSYEVENHNLIYTEASLDFLKTFLNKMRIQFAKDRGQAENYFRLIKEFCINLQAAMDTLNSLGERNSMKLHQLPSKEPYYRFIADCLKDIVGFLMSDDELDRKIAQVDMVSAYEELVVSIKKNAERVEAKYQCEVFARHHRMMAEIHNSQSNSVEQKPTATWNVEDLADFDGEMLYRLAETIKTSKQIKQHRTLRGWLSLAYTNTYIRAVKLIQDAVREVGKRRVSNGLKPFSEEEVRCYLSIQAIPKGRSFMGYPLWSNAYKRIEEARKLFPKNRYTKPTIVSKIKNFVKLRFSRPSVFFMSSDEIKTMAFTHGRSCKAACLFPESSAQGAPSEVAPVPPEVVPIAVVEAQRREACPNP